MNKWFIVAIVLHLQKRKRNVSVKQHDRNENSHGDCNGFKEEHVRNIKNNMYVKFSTMHLVAEQTKSI